VSFVIACGVRKIDVMSFFSGLVNCTTPGTFLMSFSLQSATAASPAALPRRRASFQTSTVWVPSATRLRAALSPSCPETGTLPARPWAVSAAMTPPAMPSFSTKAMSILLSLAVRNCSISVWAFFGSQLSV
jgi:hypothetical protein